MKKPDKRRSAGKRAGRRKKTFYIDGTIGQSHRAFPPGWGPENGEAEVIDVIVVDANGEPYASQHSRSPGEDRADDQGKK